MGKVNVLLAVGRNVELFITPEKMEELKGMVNLTERLGMPRDEETYSKALQEAQAEIVITGWGAPTLTLKAFPAHCQTLPSHARPAMDKDGAAAIPARGEQIKTNSAEYLWVCRGIRPPLLPDKPVATDPGGDPDHMQVQVDLPHNYPSFLRSEDDIARTANGHRLGKPLEPRQRIVLAQLAEIQAGQFLDIRHGDLVRLVFAIIKSLQEEAESLLGLIFT